MFTIFATTCRRISNLISFTHMMFFFFYFYTRTDICQFSNFDSNDNFYYQIYIHICMIHKKFILPKNEITNYQKYILTKVNIFDSFVPVILLNMFNFKSVVLFGTHTLSYRSLRVLQPLGLLYFKWMVM